MDVQLCLDMADAFFRIGTYANSLDIEAQSSAILFRCDAFYTFPAVMNLAFACELYLKAICIKNGVSFDKSHALDRLFSDLPDAIRKQLSDNFEAKVKYKVSFKETIENHSNAFIRWRYAYEDKNRDVEAYPDNLLLATEILREYIQR